MALVSKAHILGCCEICVMLQHRSELGKRNQCPQLGPAALEKGGDSPLTFLARASASHQGCLAKLVGLAA